MNNGNEHPGNIRACGQVPATEQQLLAGLEPRIFRTTLVLGTAGTAALWLWRGPGWAGGFAIGAMLSALSFRWMKNAVGALAVAIPASPPEAAGPKPRRSGGAVARFLLRYALIAAAGYAIFRSSVLSLPAFFAGLFVSIAAVLVEIGYQLYVGFRSR